jgi:hypothetical protein
MARAFMIWTETPASRQRTKRLERVVRARSCPGSCPLNTGSQDPEDAVEATVVHPWNAARFVLFGSTGLMAAHSKPVSS